MNYRHAYHAGNFADVFKHALLARILTHLTAKDTAFRYIDTHAGIGLYDLSRDEAKRTNEADAGIRRFLATPRPQIMETLFQPYIAALKAVNGMEGLHYPGSPMVAALLTRPQDRLALAELHSEDVRHLERRFDHDSRIMVRAMDGWTALKAWTPPPERRGMVLVDPPFEEKDEFHQMLNGLANAYKKWPTGTFALWYPLKATGDVRRFVGDLVNLGLPKTLRLELVVETQGDSHRLLGTGMIVVNPPWKLKQEADIILPFLARALSDAKSGHWKTEWLVGEGGGRKTGEE
ncbi:MAG: 23S rRNA (adenine(2030)-N(6))-methyltransferase RlmJ [Beijerinckiaceae bacterium]